MTICRDIWIALQLFSVLIKILKLSFFLFVFHIILCLPKVVQVGFSW